MSFDPSVVQGELRQAIRGEVLADEVSLGLYATDASNYQILPVVVVLPLDANDVRSALTIASRHRLPILPRGGGTSLAGQTVAAAMVLDLSKYMNRILDLDVKARTVRVEPGVVRDELNAVVAEHGLHFAPDPSTANRANVGGMIGNNSSGAKSILFGKTIDHVEELKVLLVDGTTLDLRSLSPDELAARTQGNTREAEICRGLRRIVDENRDEIAARYPKVMRRVGGYPLDELVSDYGWNPAKILVGSEGTLAVTLEAKLRLEPLPRHKSICVAHFRELLEAIHAVEQILPLGPSAVEVLDHTVLRLARDNRAAAQICDFLEGDPAAVLIVEFYGDTAADVADRAHRVAVELDARDLGYAYPVVLDSAGQARVWEVRKNGLGLMLGMKGDRKPLPFIEDAAVPIPVLPEYIAKVLDICRSLDVDAAMYAHASVGVIHVRPILDLRKSGDIEKMRRIAERTFELVVQYGGAWSGEHGDGLVRSSFNERYFGAQLYRAFAEIKELFDPQNLMNPGKIVDAPPMHQNLRYGETYHVNGGDSVFQYRADGSFAAAIEMCSGVGACRKTLGGTMCPSYMATRDEEHSTRGRANALRLAMSGQLGPEGLTSRRLREALDLCISCKACKTECPSNVDMATLKSDVLQKVYDRHGSTLRDRLIRDSPMLARQLVGRWAPVVNSVQASLPFRILLETVAGFDRRRTLPAVADEPLRRWMAGQPAIDGGREVALFADTYLDCHEPGSGKAAVELLTACGYRVVLVSGGCCQRPRITHGFLRLARQDGEATLRQLDAYVQRGVPVLVCEPSCASALTDDLPDLVGDRELADRVAAGVTMIDVFLDAEVAAGRLEPGFKPSTDSVLIHGHCHQKALYGTEAMKRVLSQVPGLVVDEVDSGCCGMAGSFGYEKEHYEISRTIGEDRLFPAIRELDEATTIIACGFSCRHQIEHFTGRRARHWVEVVRDQLLPGAAGMPMGSRLCR